MFTNHLMLVHNLMMSGHNLMMKMYNLMMRKIIVGLLIAASIIYVYMRSRE